MQGSWKHLHAFDLPPNTYHWLTGTTPPHPSILCITFSLSIYQIERMEDEQSISALVQLYDFQSPFFDGDFTPPPLVRKEFVKSRKNAHLSCTNILAPATSSSLKLSRFLGLPAMRLHYCWKGLPIISFLDRYLHVKSLIFLLRTFWTSEKGSASMASQRLHTILIMSGEISPFNLYNWLHRQALQLEDEKKTLSP